MDRKRQGHCWRQMMQQATTQEQRSTAERQRGRGNRRESAADPFVLFISLHLHLMILSPSLVSRHSLSHSQSRATFSPFPSLLQSPTHSSASASVSAKREDDGDGCIDLQASDRLLSPLLLRFLPRQSKGSRKGTRKSERDSRRRLLAYHFRLLISITRSLANTHAAAAAGLSFFHGQRMDLG